MFEKLKKEMNSFFNDLDNTIHDEITAKYIKQISSEIVNAMLGEFEEILTQENQKLNIIMRKQLQSENKLENLKEKVDNIYEDIYDEQDESFVITCPYCNAEFEIDIDENLEEIKCVECGNIIELDWNGSPGDGEDFGCSGNCSHCDGCDN